MDLIDEIVGLGSVRLEKACVLFDSALVLELYSHKYKKLYFVFDQNPETMSTHVQEERPKGLKTMSPFISLVKKHLVGKLFRFHRLDMDSLDLKASFKVDERYYSLIFENFPKPAVGLFCKMELLASMKRGAPARYRDEILTHNGPDLGLFWNLSRAKRYEEERDNFWRSKIFEHRVSVLKQKIKKKNNLLRNLQQDLAKCRKNLELENDAELLRVNMHLIKRGMKDIELMDYCSSPPQMRRLVLDGSISKEQYLEKLFNKVKRAKRGITVIEPRIASVENELISIKNELSRLLSIGEDAVDPDEEDWSTISGQPSKRKKDTARVPYKTYLSSDGIKILVGRSAKDSDELVLRHARGNEWWFHCRMTTGAHVVVKHSSDELPSSTLMEALLLAKHFSKDRTSPHSTVQYTRIKYVRKPKGFVAGKVLISQEKSMEVLLDEDRLGRILAREQV